MLAYFYTKKCQAAIEENKSYFMAIYANPGSLVKFNVSGALVDAAEGGLMGLAQFADNYLEQNADALVMAALKATGLESTFEEAMNLCMNLMAAAVMGQNNLVLKCMKELSWNLMKTIVEKDDKLYEVAELVKQLYIILASLIETVPEWDTYYDKLREALRLIESTKADLGIVKSTYKSSNKWLSKKFEGTVAKLETARDLITPKKNSPAVSRISEGSYKLQQGLKTGKPDKTKPKGDLTAQAKAKTKLIDSGLTKMRDGLAFFGKGLSDQFPFPTSEEQWQAMVALNKVSGKVTKSLQGYFELNARVDLMIAAFLTGVDDFQSGVTSIFQKYINNLLDANIARLDVLSDDMAFSLNGDPAAKSGPIADKNAMTGKFTPNSLTITTMSFKWIMDINLIFQSYKLIPTKQLEALTLSQGAVDVYKSIAARLTSMGDRKSGLAVLRMKQAQEETADLETQVMALVLESNIAVVSGKVRRGILSLCRTVLSRLELSFVTDHEIYSMMLTFYNTPLPDETSLDQSYGSLTDNFKKAGLDRAVACLASGDFKKLFKLSGKDASYVGAALAALAFLKKCLGKNFSWQLRDAESDLNSSLDLLNVQFSINFDLGILKNLLVCFKLNGLVKMFDPLEILCAIARDIAAGGSSNTSKMFKDIDDIFNKIKD